MSQRDITEFTRTIAGMSISQLLEGHCEVFCHDCAESINVTWRAEKNRHGVKFRYLAGIEGSRHVLAVVNADELEEAVREAVELTAKRIEYNDNQQDKQ